MSASAIDIATASVSVPIDIECKEGYRHVAPYWCRWSFNVKLRYDGSTLLYLLQTEYKSPIPKYYLTMIESGRVWINDRLAKPDGLDIVRAGMNVVCLLHRHEPPVLMNSKENIQIVSETDDLLVINKPNGINVHPCGRYQQNTLTSLIERSRQHSLKLFPVHRLDRVVSGALIFAKTSKTSRIVSSLFQSHAVEKVYLARVVGRFNVGNVTESKQVHVSHRNRDNMHEINNTNTILVSEDDRNSKSALTHFSLLSYDSSSNTSVVECRPVSGRSHQIRQHLQALNHSIVNDIMYGGKAFSHCITPLSCAYTQVDVKHFDSKCAECNHNEVIDGEGGFNHTIWLHCLQMQFADPEDKTKIYSFNTEPPIWSNENYDVLSGLGNEL